MIAPRSEKRSGGNHMNAMYDARVRSDHWEKTIMQVVLGSTGSKVSLDEFVGQMPLDEIEIVNADGKAVAYLVPAPRAGDATYTKFEAVFQSHAEVLHRRAANPSPGITTEALLAKFHAQTGTAK